MSLYPEQITSVIVPAHIPPMRTKRLLLRPAQMTDAAAIFEFRSRQEVADFLWSKVPHKEINETEAFIASKTFTSPDASGAVGRHFHFVFIRANDPSMKVIGCVGINALVPSPSIGFGTHPDFWGQGYASEAVGGVVDAWWKLERTFPKQLESSPDMDKLFAACNKANVGSVNVLRRNGFEIYEELQLEGDAVELFELQMPELNC